LIDECKCRFLVEAEELGVGRTDLVERCRDLAVIVEVLVDPVDLLVW
jgi:hypothetical protein